MLSPFLLLNEQIGKWSTLTDQLFSISDVAPEGCHLSYLVTGVVFLAMLQVCARALALEYHDALRSVPCARGGLGRVKTMLSLRPS